jgi:ABC-2 type transport system permease protein
MFQQTFAIVRNTFFESIRQPIMLVVLVVATLAIVLSNPLSGYTMSDDQKMYIDVGLATVFISGAILAAFIATSVLGREIENRTALTVISKPVSRPVFVIGKYLGVAGALALGTIYMSFVFMLVEQHTVLQTVREPVHVPVVIFGVSAALLGLAIGVWCNYFYNMVFSSTVICVTTPLAGLAYFFSLMFRHDFTLQPIGHSFKLQLWLGLAGLLVAILVLTAIAIAASTRLGQVMTLCVTVGVFLAGMLSDWVFGRPVAQMQLDWSQRIKDKSDQELQGLMSPSDISALQAWVSDVRTEEALRQFSLWHCAFLGELQKPELKTQLKQLTEADRQTQTLKLENESQANASAKLADDLARTRQTVESMHWPAKRGDVVLEVDWPLMVERTNGECEVVRNKKTVVFPPLQSAVATGHERLVHASLLAASAIVPNFQVLWLSDAITQEHRIPLSYLARSALYGLVHIVAFLCLATFLFQRREVG